MQYNWIQVVEHIRNFVQNRTKILGDTPENTRRRMSYFERILRQTDTFHPWNSDGELSRALDRMPKYCNYRSIKPYWAWKNGREAVCDACFSILEEIDDLICEWHENEWNHAPGYKKPLKVEFTGSTEDDCVKLAQQIIAQCQKNQ